MPYTYIVQRIGLTLSQTSPGFYGSNTFENTMGKGEIAHNEQFPLFPSVFYLFVKTFCLFREIWNCRLQTRLVSKRLKFVVWEGLIYSGKVPIYVNEEAEETNSENNLKLSLQTLSFWKSLKFVVWEKLHKVTNSDKLQCI